jgi:hypothetical protein
MKDQNENTNETTEQEGARKRRYVRLEIFSPVGFAGIVIDDDKRARLQPEEKAGVLLNLSGGGALISTTDPVVEDELLLMKFDIKGFDVLTDILCRVKRVEAGAEDDYLFGVQFMSPQELDDPVVAKSLDRLTAQPQGFAEGISRLISRYVFQRQVEAESDQ